MASVPRSRLYYFVKQGMHFRVTVTLRASHVERWICHVQWEFLDRAPENSMCLVLDCEYTNAVKNVKQKNLPLEKKHRAIVLQFSMASETLVFQICHTDAVLKLLREFLNNDEIMF
jgi:outer membrane receptor for Fe3+-dicitrate